MNTTMPAAQDVSDTLQALKDLQAYEEAISQFDWSFEFSDDGRVYRDGKAKLARLHELQAKVDPQGEMWNLYKPNTMGAPNARVAA